MIVLSLVHASGFDETPWALQDATPLQQSQYGFLTESPHVMELRYVENLEEVKAKIVILEQQLADQPGSKDLEDKLVDARE